jgi:hypothetical protein
MTGLRCFPGEAFLIKSREPVTFRPRFLSTG